MRVLLVRAGALGDVLLLRSAVAALHAAGHTVWLLAPASSGSVLLGPGASEVEGLIPWDHREVGALLSGNGVPAGPLRDTLAAFDVAVAYTRSAALVRGLDALAGRVIAHDPLPAAGAGHASLWMVRPIEVLGAPVEAGRASRARRALTPPVDRTPLLEPTAEERAAARPFLDRLPEGFLAIHPGSGSASKNWPAARFAALAGSRAAGGPWLLIEGPADEAAAALLRECHGAVLARRLQARVLAAILARAGVYAGNDSGVTHLAAACGPPTVALFGPTDPSVWSPLGEHVRVVRAASGAMDAIGVEEVAQTIDSARRAVTT